MNPSEIKQLINIEKLKQTARKGQVRTPQFMGWQQDLTIEEVQEIIKNSKRSKGFSQDISASSRNDLDVQLSGNAKMFLGLALVFTNSFEGSNNDFRLLPDTVTLKINNEIVFEDIHPLFLTLDFMDDEYYFYPRPLSGQDTITLSTNSSEELIMKSIFYYI